ncbi:hypothetical protein HEK131_15630 [Streptomyces seoulensis]|nr:hypothetical protein HEK131_15630 [Streptomyces seoulensis]
MVRPLHRRTGRVPYVLPRRDEEGQQPDRDRDDDEHGQGAGEGERPPTPGRLLDLRLRRHVLSSLPADLGNSLRREGPARIRGGAWEWWENASRPGAAER